MESVKFLNNAYERGQGFKAGSLLKEKGSGEIQKVYLFDTIGIHISMLDFTYPFPQRSLKAFWRGLNSLQPISLNFVSGLEN
jgi:hypothetical protein